MQGKNWECCLCQAIPCSAAISKWKKLLSRHQTIEPKIPPTDSAASGVDGVEGGHWQRKQRYEACVCSLMIGVARGSVDAAAATHAERHGTSCINEYACARLPVASFGGLCKVFLGTWLEHRHAGHLYLSVAMTFQGTFHGENSVLKGVIGPTCGSTPCDLTSSDGEV